MASKWTMTQLRSCGHSFKNFPMALYAVDVTFQKTNAPVGSFAEKKRFFSKKHGQYGLKVEVSVLPNGYAINVTSAAPGSIADLTICEENEGFHLVMLAKRPDEESMHDNGRHQEQHPGSWALLADKGYQGLQRRLRAITPTKKPPGGMLSSSELVQNDKIASDRVIVEKVFGRLKTLWAIVSDTYMWKRENYDMFFGTCVALTNVHIQFMPLQQEDGDEYNRYLNRILEIGASMKARRSKLASTSREKRKMRLSTLIPSVESFDEVYYDSGDNSGIFDE
ncbi:hypothetical protein H310_05074 [Aphanomyces invadans]|uniref:DDE Tnp4 domain-containing protein n=1 Tax=Aphanomyces invadans TaxID=157072 RepID=A0A024UDG8_9STRA|nr:hypothetical protein H310_05074 [Aphanomyces invadans]ETW03688.1 hypothetical protein H310_05074 [Aphanomyces invadans]|eukprot:XP_008867917.1 hypothetical protein H310_05074 [Aphanomyces invadans]